MPGTLYLVATPIGNLGDLSPRAAQVLSEADFIAAEDTRVSIKLLNHLALRRPLVSYHQHNRASAGPAILARLLAGESCALVTDAGTPAISDPGEDLVRLCADNGVPVQAVPGCCALITALAVSGLATGRFVFEGFLPVNRGERRERLAKLAGEERTMIFYEAPHRLRTTLDDLLSAFGDRPAALVTDAGTPAISDPGEDLVRLCADSGVPVQAVPGCCALITALAVSGLDTGRFVFEGFLPVNRGERRERLAKLAGEERTMIFYEAPHRLRTTLDDLLSAFGDRPAALCRELTKLHEETLRLTLAQAADHYRDREPRGEYVIVLAGGEPEAGLSLEEGAARVLALRAEGVKMKDAVRQVAAATGLGRNELYQAAIQGEAP